MDNNNIGTENTDAQQTTNQDTANTDKFYTQEEFDQHMARMKASIQKKYEKTFAELGDINELKQLKTEAEKRKTDEQVKRGEFEKILQDLASKKDAEIQRRDEIIKAYTVDTPLVAAAAQYRAVNADQVKALLKPKVRLNDSGEVEVLDEKGTVRYNDKGQPFRVEDLVKEFLDTNPHFVAPGASTTQSKSNVSQSREKLDISKLDMKNPEHRKVYAELRKQRGLA
jgi:hypothetical protein